LSQINAKIAKQDEALATYEAFNIKWKGSIIKMMEDNPHLDIPMPSFEFEDIDLSKYRDEDNFSDVENDIITESLAIMDVDVE
jgi:hypothetical protein